MSILQSFSLEQMLTLADAMTHLSGAMVTKAFGHLVHLSEQEVVLRALYHNTASVLPDKVMLSLGTWGVGGGGGCMCVRAYCVCTFRYVHVFKA